MLSLTNDPRQILTRWRAHRGSGRSRATDGAPQVAEQGEVFVAGEFDEACKRRKEDADPRLLPALNEVEDVEPAHPGCPAAAGQRRPATEEANPPFSWGRPRPRQVLSWVVRPSERPAEADDPPAFKREEEDEP